MAGTTGSSLPESSVILFPMKHRKGKIRHVAAIFAKKRGKDRDAYWRRTLETLRKQSAAAGVAPEVAERHLVEFSVAVVQEVQRYELGRKGA
ncbi:DUF6074 family protein [Polycladidibacter stylochi]|uniref:DUF6074 family protein n=1 Tax=Polycladidibacter stylochi TaxID=1807766 RepID=UPI00083615B2|nr:DUF6074 family protein [Pseudovibrio stylochi]